MLVGNSGDPSAQLLAKLPILLQGISVAESWSLQPDSRLDALACGAKNVECAGQLAYRASLVPSYAPSDSKKLHDFHLV